MEIIRADIIGFCFGVRRAVEMAHTALDENPAVKVYSLGPLIHNETTLKKLADKGLFIVEENDCDSIENESFVIIRAHGVAPSVMNKLNDKHCRIFDATCPRVKNSQKIVERNKTEKDYIIFTGDKNHGEVKSIEGYADKNFVLLQNAAEADFFVKVAPSDKKVMLMSQTTFSTREFGKITDILKSKYNNLEVQNTICPATKERQEALRELCAKVDGVLVIGGKNSANTNRLYQIAQENCQKAAFIQTAEDIPDDFYSLSKVGLTAGASTPDELILEVEESLKKNAR